jgi:hypothetical protein
VEMTYVALGVAVVGGLAMVSAANMPLARTWPSVPLAFTHAPPVFAISHWDMTFHPLDFIAG